jgi:hypothetical protein
VAAAIDGTFSGEDARPYMRVDGYVLQDHPNFHTWSEPVSEVRQAKLG